jgi:hypothetical protein
LTIRQSDRAMSQRTEVASIMQEMFPEGDAKLSKAAAGAATTLNITMTNAIRSTSAP